LTPYTVIKCCVLTHPPDIILIFDIIIAHNGDEPLKETSECISCISGRKYSLTPRHYNPCRVLADSRSRLQSSLSLALQFLTPNFSASIVTPSFHLRFGLPARNDKTFQVPILKHCQGRLRLEFSFLPRLIL